VTVKGKGKAHPVTRHEGTAGEQRYRSTLPLTSVLDGGEWSTLRPRPFYPRERDPVPIVQEVEYVVGPAKNMWLLMML
jgi:hypothetical protein